MHINENIKKIRLLRKLSQQEVAEKIGEKRSTYANWERETVPQADVLARIAAALGVSIDQILSDDLRSSEVSEGDATGVGYGLKAEVARLKALTTVLLGVAVEQLSATSGEMPEVVRRRLERAADEIERMDKA